MESRPSVEEFVGASGCNGIVGYGKNHRARAGREGRFDIHQEVQKMHVAYGSLEPKLKVLAETPSMSSSVVNQGT